MAATTYGFAKSLPETPFPEAVARVTDALKEEGFGVLTEIDVQATLKKKLDVEMRPYLILGACNPKLARQAIEHEPHIGLLLPCNVLIQETGAGSVEVSIADPKAMFALVGQDAPPALQAVADDARARLKRVVDRLS